MSRSRVTTDHDEIRNWAEERGGQPVAVKGTARGKQDVGIIRIDFPGYSGEGKLAPISWDEWFEKFDESKLGMILQDETSGGEKSNFNKLVSRETAEEAADGKGTTRRRARTARRSTAKQATGARARKATSKGGTRKRGTKKPKARTRRSTRR